MEKQEKPLLRPFEKLFLFAAIILIAALFLQQRTGKVWQTTETEVFTPGLAPNGLTHFENEKIAELEKLSAAFSIPDFEKNEVDFWQKSELSVVEKDFYKSLREQKKSVLKSQKADPNTWFEILKAARKTYQKVNDVLEVERLSPKKDSAAAAEKTVLDFEKMFGVSADLGRVFGTKKGRTVAEWAIFIQEKMELTH